MMTVFKNTALKVKAFAMFNLKSALLSFTVLSLSSCATDPKVLEQESKEAQALSATDFTILKCSLIQMIHMFISTEHVVFMMSHITIWDQNTEGSVI